MKPSRKENLTKTFLKSDMLTTRGMVGLSSLLFSIILSVHFFRHNHALDLLWIVFSFVHAITVFWSLTCGKTNKYTFIGEALFGFIIWNYISLIILMSFDSVVSAFSPAGAPLAPTFMAGIATWWILARYPRIQKQ